jgi:TetR/AcrR family transcriptional repressor of nem operon
VNRSTHSRLVLERSFAYRLARLEGCFTAALRTAIRLGEVPASVDPVARARGLVATSQGLMVVGKVNPDEGVLRAIVDNAFTGLS